MVLKSHHDHHNILPSPGDAEVPPGPAAFDACVCDDSGCCGQVQPGEQRPAVWDPHGPSVRQLRLDASAGRGNESPFTLVSERGLSAQESEFRGAFFRKTTNRQGPDTIMEENLDTINSEASHN